MCQQPRPPVTFQDMNCGVHKQKKKLATGEFAKLTGIMIQYDSKD